jgi:hypothetical protein
MYAWGPSERENLSAACKYVGKSLGAIPREDNNINNNNNNNSYNNKLRLDPQNSGYIFNEFFRLPAVTTTNAIQRIDGARRLLSLTRAISGLSAVTDPNSNITF